MIKLIVSDIDGTLLKNYSDKISEQFFNIQKKFNEKGIIFVAASGRHHEGLTLLFDKIKDNIYFISSNGSTIKFKNEFLFKDFIPLDLVKIVFNQIKLKSDCELIVSTENTSYVLSQDGYVEKLMSKELKSKVCIKNVKFFEEIVDDNILKLSIFNRNGIKNIDFSNIFNNVNDRLKGAVSGDCWFDLMNANINKGSAIEYLCKMLNIKLEEVVAFGDNFNDIEMLSKVGYSYAMNSAAEDVKKVSKFECEKVEDTLNELYNKIFN